ncbi:hypothetical protein COC42_05130 [Sphingomonas spermidinifaciens]|uniref:Uncharacterized protein n=1 Tax=Sphingomonas spermidinifaciens TaxID=1141889 RepID=A0A2A4B7W1_9SPHN|nr:hypothetical protein [Sphingomonas spermidinifaciens]PCD03736.1 hypothetical protein COC42_05130 [Sphingomonas spermidinifaciens]
MFFDESGIWGVVVIVGPIILAGIIAWAMLRNRGASRHEVERTEAATRRLYDEQNAEDIAREER